VVPFWAHRLQDCLLQALPHWALDKYLMNLHLNIRSKFLHKKNAAAAAPVAGGAPAAPRSR